MSFSYGTADPTLPATNGTDPAHSTTLVGGSSLVGGKEREGTVCIQ